MEIQNATEANAETIASQETVTETPSDVEIRLQQLEEEKENYRKAYLKSEEQRKAAGNETEDERIARLVDERIANSRMAEIEKERGELLAKTLKENKELKLAQMNKPTDTPTAGGSHTETITPTDTTITPDQLAHFKSRGWSDEMIERYKVNLKKKV